MENDFVYSEEHFQVTKEMKKLFNEHGYVVVRGLLSTNELAKLNESLGSDGEIVKHSYGRSDGHGRTSRLCIWTNPGEDITGMLAKSDKVVSTTEELLEGLVDHYHSKLIMKEPHTGGSFVWHQDYGYWYNNGFLLPDLATVFIAIDKADAGNGCLKVLQGSHKVGRIEHVRIGDQTGADIERVEHLMKMFPLVEVELNPGDAFFFHSNVLHRSDQNHSDRRRWALLLTYNTRANRPVKKHHPQWSAIEKVPNTAILQCQRNAFVGDFMDPETEELHPKIKSQENG